LAVVVASYNGEFTVKLLDEKRRLLVSIDQQQKMKAVAIDDADTFIVEGGTLNLSVYMSTQAYPMFLVAG
jgi:hypothetical protein